MTIKEFGKIPNNVQIVSPSQWLAEKFSTSYLENESNRQVIRNPVPKSFSNRNRERTRMELGIKPQDFVATFAAANLNNPYKGLDYFLKAVDFLPKGENIVILLIGNGRALKIPSGNVIQVNAKNDTQMSSYLSASDVVVVPSEEDNSPSLILESQACGTPVIGSYVGGIPELLGFDENSLFSVGDIKRIANLIQNIKLKGPNTSQMNSSKRIEEYDSVQPFIKAYLDCLNN